MRGLLFWNGLDSGLILRWFWFFGRLGLAVSVESGTERPMVGGLELIEHYRDAYL